MKKVLEVLLGILAVICLVGLMLGVNLLKTSYEAKNANNHPPRQQQTQAIADSVKLDKLNQPALK
jgi:hypothetical protein